MTQARRLTAEAVGTAFLLAAVVGSGIMGERFAGGNVGIALVANALATGAMVHPPGVGHLWKAADTWSTGWLGTPSASPDERMAMFVPVGRRIPHGVGEFVPGLEASPLQSERAENLPPRFNQVQIGRALGLADELPPGLSQLGPNLTRGTGEGRPLRSS